MSFLGIHRSRNAGLVFFLKMVAVNRELIPPSFNCKNIPPHALQRKISRPTVVALRLHRFFTPFGGVGNETLVTYTNAVNTGEFKICKTTSEPQIIARTRVRLITMPSLLQCQHGVYAH